MISLNVVQLGSYVAAWWRNWPFAAPALWALLPALGGRARQLTPLNSWCDWDMDLPLDVAAVTELPAIGGVSPNDVMLMCKEYMSSANLMQTPCVFPECRCLKCDA